MVDVSGPVQTLAAAAEDGAAAGQADGRLAGSPAAHRDTALAEPSRAGTVEMP